MTSVLQSVLPYFVAAKADCAHFSLFYFPIKIIESSFKQL